MSKSIRISTADAITEAAFEVFNRNPGASLSEVAQIAGVGRATLHRYYSSREELLRSLVRQALLEMDEAANLACENVDSYADALQETLKAMIPLGDRYHFLTTESYEGDEELQKEIERQSSELAGMVESAKKEGLFHSDIPTRWIVHAYEHLIYAAWECVREETATHKQAAALAWRTLVSGTS